VTSPDVTATTTVAAVIGDPIRHSLSPVLHNAAFRANDLDWVFVAFEVAAGGARDALAAMRALRFGGLSVTMPHKHDAAAACDALTDDAATLASVNCVVPRADGSLLGDSTDGEGFLRSLRDAGHDPAGASVLLLGAGGAARAIAVALGRSGCRVQVAARRSEEAVRTAALVAGAAAVPWEERHDVLASATLVVNATPVGMGGGHDSALRPDALGEGHLVADLVYHPIDTPLLRAAREQGCATVDGLGMLVHQAALAFERWTGTSAPVPVMAAAARAAIAPGP